LNINDEIRLRIEKTEKLLEQLKDKSTLAYLQGLHALKTDCEIIGDLDKAYEYASSIIFLLGNNKIIYNNTIDNTEKVRDIWVRAYDTKARQGHFESFCIALEWNRPIHKQFYLPRARLLKKHGVIQGVQDLIDDKLDLLVLNLPPRIGKSTVGLFLQVLLGGMCPDESILASGHSVSLVQSFYAEIMNIIMGEEYRYNEIFPNNQIVDKSAEYYYIDLNKKRRNLLKIKQIPAIFCSFHSPIGPPFFFTFTIRTQSSLWWQTSHPSPKLWRRHNARKVQCARRKGHARCTPRA
jgi:hypothetical protein